MKPIPTETATDVGNVGKWLGACAAGALLMYLLDPERGSARRTRAMMALREAGTRTGASVDQALHSAGDALDGLKDSAAGALARDGRRLRDEPPPERPRHAAQQASARFAAGAREREYARDRAPAWGGHSATARGGLAEWLHALGAGGGANSALLGGGMLGLLGLMRRSPASLLVGLAGLALLMRGGSRRYAVGSLALPHSRHGDAPPPYLPSGAAPAGSRYLH